MSNKQIMICDVSKTYDNPLAELVNVACQYNSSIYLETNDHKINAKSIMGIMAFNPSEGMNVNIIAEGSDEEKALTAMEKYLTCK
ncbi:MAG: HPr family phosphocarrier protein [Lachnospiraceae bacterium]|nr:HPr family phosphocarrier protein [Lachnospiraceae bacterium]